MKKLSYVILSLATLICCGCGTASDKGCLPRGEVSSEWIAAADAFCAEAELFEAPDKAVPISMMAVDHGNVVFERYLEDVAPDSLFHVFSIAKTILAIGVGCAVDEGLLSTGDRVVDFFPDKLPQSVSDTLLAMTVDNLLTMTCGKEETPKQLSVFTGNDDFDWAEEFFNSFFTSYPGERFYYNLFAPYMMACILEKVTGMGVVDYIRPRILDPMRITDLRWDKSPEGVCIGGWGLYLCIEDMAKFGQLLLQHGEWEGRQAVSSEWIDTMTSDLVPSAPLCQFTKGLPPEILNDPRNHHSHGYGYYVWMDENGAYRIEGMAGRYIFVNPEKETVFAIISDANIDNEYMDLIWKHFGSLI